MNRRTFFLGWPGSPAARGYPSAANVYNWSAYMAPETVPGFEAEFGVRVRYATYESNEEMLAKVLGGNSGWDIVFPTHTRLRADARERPARAAAARVAARTGKPGARFRSPHGIRTLLGVPYMWNATGIVYNRTVQPPPARWADLWISA